MTGIGSYDEIAARRYARAESRPDAFALRLAPRILLVNSPTRGVDLGARQEIYHALDRLTSEGLGVILLSEDLPELIGLAHRIVVFRNNVLETTIVNDPPVGEAELVARMI